MDFDESINSRKTSLTFSKSLGLISCFIYVLIAFVDINGPAWRERSNQIADIVTSNPINQIAYSIIFVLSFASILPHYRKFLDWISREKYILFFLLWCGITMLWSIDLLTSFKRYFQYVTTSLVFIGILLNWGNTEVLLKVLKYVLITFIIISLGSVLISPLAIDPSFGTWRGIHGHKNMLGQTAGISVIFFAFLFFTEPKKNLKVLYLFPLVLSVTLLVGSFSMTPMILIILLSFFFLLRYSDKVFEPLGFGKFASSFIIFYLVLVASFAYFFASDLIESLFYIIGKDPTLTGRTDIWYLVLSISIDDIITGVGFQAFWIPEKLSKIILFQYWLPNQSHNGYVDIILETGIIGLILFLLLVFNIIKNNLNSENKLWVVFIVFALLVNFAESTLIRPHHITNVFFYMSFWVLSFNKYKGYLE